MPGQRVRGRFLGIDVGARRLHGVAVEDGLIGHVEVFPSADLQAVVDWAEDVDGIAIDSPDAWSSEPHADEQGLAPKFRRARCAEIALGRQFGIWVPWTTPVSGDGSTWIGAGIALFEVLRAAGQRPLEVFPYAAFRSLNANRPLPRKQTRDGAVIRAALLSDAGVTVPLQHSWSHDATDAAVAALVALQHHAGTAVAATCGHDGSAIWLPAPTRP